MLFPSNQNLIPFNRISKLIMQFKAYLSGVCNTIFDKVFPFHFQ